MSARTILTTAGLKGIDLLDPKPSDIDFADIAEHLAKENRFNGATPGVCYSVAEHCVRGCDSIFRQHSDGQLAAYFLLHDAHEAYLKDDTTPKKQLVAEIAEKNFGVLQSQIIAAFDLAPYRFDQAIHDAAGLAWPPSSGLIAAIKRWDMIMFVTEWRDLMKGAAHPDWAPYQTIEPLKDIIVPMNWREAQRQFRVRCHALLPCFGKDAA